MAANVLQSNKGRQNFQRVTRLLIAGATTIGRKTFDAIHPPDTLATVLGDPARQVILLGAKMTRPQWQQVYPSPGKYGRSEDWDLTLLHKMLRSICGLTSPATGWDDLPPDSDVSKEADLARLKYYRNSVYGHVDERMQIKDEEFQKLWKDISEAIIRLAGHLSSAKKKEWEEAIEDFLTAPLTSDDVLNIEELKSWYRQDVEMRQELLKLKVGIDELIRHVEPTKQRCLDPTFDTCPILHHDNQLVEWFCLACQEYVCRTCVTLHHTTHPRVNMNNLAHMQTVTQELLDTSEKVRSEIEKHQKLIREIQNNGSLRNNKLNKLKNEIKATVNKWIEQLREQEEKLHKDIETTQKIYQEKDDNQVSEITKHVENMETWVRYTEKLANDGSAVNKVTQKEQTLKCKDDVIAMDLKLEPQTITGCQFIANGILSQEIKDVGTVSLWDCVADGEGLQQTIVGIPSTLTIKTVAVCGTQRQILHYPTALSVKVHSPQDSVIPTIQDNKDGTYKVSFVASHPGDHEISATVEGQEILGSSFFVKVNQCILNGKGCRKGIVGLKSQFKDDLLGLRNEKLNDSNIVLKVKPQSPQDNVCPVIQDTYYVSFVPTHPGDYELSATVNGQEIPSSPPLIAKVKQCVLTSGSLTKGVVGLRSQFKVSFHDQYGEKLDNLTIKINVEIQSPQGTVIPAIQNNKDGTYLVSFFPVLPGDHHVSITVRSKLSQSEHQQQANVNCHGIPCNPFTVAVKPRQFELVLTFGKSGNKRGEFMLPWGVAVNDKDEIIVADRDNHRVHVFSCNGEHLGTIGKRGTGAGKLDRPYGVVSGNNNNIIVADNGNCRVQMFTETGEFIRSFGSRGRDNGQLKNPNGLSLDTDGNIIVTDCGNGRVQVFSNHGKWLESFDCGERPKHCVAHGDRYYVSSHSDHSIKVFDKSGTFLCRYGARGSSPGAFKDPSGLAVEKAGHLIVCDTWNNRVQVLEMDGTFVDSFGVEGEGLGQVRSPSTVAVMRDGKIVVCDTCNDRIQVFE